MRLYHALVPALACLCFLGACDKPTAGTSGKEVVFASLAPVAGLLERIVDDEIDVRVFVGEGQDPHDFSPSTGQLAALGNAKALFLSGMDFEAALKERLKGDKSGLVIVDLVPHEEGESEEHEEHEEHEDHEGHEGHNHSHAWLSPYDLEGIVEEAQEALAGIFPDKAKVFEKNSGELLAEIKSLNEDISAKLKPFADRPFFTYHAAFDAFACAYDLDENAVEVEGKTPTPTELAKFLEKAKEEGASALIVQPQFDTKSAEAVAKELNLDVVSIDPMSKDVLGNIRKLAGFVEQALTN